MRLNGTVIGYAVLHGQDETVVAIFPREIQARQFATTCAGSVVVEVEFDDLRRRYDQWLRWGGSWEDLRRPG